MNPLGCREARQILERTAAAHPLVTKEPPPVLVTKLGPDSITFELRAWAARTDQWMQTGWLRCDL